MLLYQGSRYVRGNKFKDNNGTILTFEKNTKDGRLFSTESGIRVGLTESQVKKLKLVERKALGKGLEDLMKDNSKEQKGQGLKALFNGGPLNLDSDGKAAKRALSKLVFDSDDEFRAFVNKLVDEIIAERK